MVRDNAIDAGGRGGMMSNSFSGNERNRLFLNQGAGDYQDVSANTGLDNIADGRAFAYLDYDRDGWQDIVLVNANAPLLNLYRNEISSQANSAGRSVAVKLVGGNHESRPSPDLSNRDGYGTLVTAVVGERRLLREHRCGEGFAAQNSTTMLIGIGDATTVDRLEVRWPSGRRQEIDQIDAGSLVTIYEADETGGPGTHEIDTYEAASRSEATRDRRASTTFSVPSDRLMTVVESGGSAPRLRLFQTMATWCSACKRWMPQLDQLRSQFSEQDLGLYAIPIDPDDNPEMLTNYLDSYHPNYRLHRGLTADEKTAIQERIVDHLGSDVTPVSILLDDTGAVLSVLEGLPSASQIAEWLAQPE